MSERDQTLRVCLLQIESKSDLTETLIHLRNLVATSIEKYQPKIIALPECFNFDYCTEPSVLNAAAESISGPTCSTLSELSKKFGVFIVGGSIIERDGSNLYNTSTVWNPNGELIARHRKVHLCDCHLENGTDVVEVGTLTAGNDITTFDVDGFKCGIAICYDNCFDEFIKLYGKVGCDLLFIPVAYPISVGTLHWELHLRARAVDNQLFVAGISPARNEQADYVVYGFSSIIDPLGNILAQAGTTEDIVFYEIDREVATKIRKGLPLIASRRTDVYKKYNEIYPN